MQKQVAIFSQCSQEISQVVLNQMKPITKKIFITHLTKIYLNSASIIQVKKIRITYMFGKQ